MQRYTSRLGSSDWLVARWMLIIRPAVVTAILGAAILVLPKEYFDWTPIVAVLVGTYVLTLLYWFAHYITGVSRLLLATQIAFDIFIVTVIVHYTDGYDSFFFGLYLLSVMCASLFFRRLVTYMFATQATVFYVVDIFLLGDPVPANVMRIVILQTSLYVLLMYGLGFFSSYFGEKLRGKDTALTNALHLLREAKLDTLDILQSMSNGLIAVDSVGRVMYMNSVASAILDIEEGRAVGRNYATVFGPRTEQLVRVIDCQLVAISTVSEKEIEVRNLQGNVIPLGLSSMPLYDTDGSRRGAIVHFKDLTERKQLIDMLRQSERMAAIGELSAAIAHEIRNPLASINNAVELLEESINAVNPQDSRLLEVIVKESGRLQKISTEFLDFARMNNPEIGRHNLKQLVDDVLILVDNDPRKTDSIIIRDSIPEDTFVSFDGDQLRQLILNVLINSLDALDGEGTITIRIEESQDSPGDYIRMVISDNGPGFPKGYVNTVFEPFFSTKKNGTGLGLALVRKIAVANAGRVTARNGNGGGAEVVLDMRTTELKNG